MPDLPDRARLEDELAQAVQAANDTVLNEIYKRFGNPPRVERVDEAGYAYLQDVMQAQYTQALQAPLERAHVAGAIAQADDWSIGVDFDTANEAAARWARVNAFPAGTQLANRRLQYLRDSLGDYFEQRMTIADLERRFSTFFGESQARTIASTEITRASVQGEMEMARQLESEGKLRFREIHQTNNDDRVCPICGPRHDQEITDGIYPPLHPGCRCWVNREVVIDEQR